MIERRGIKLHMDNSKNTSRKFTKVFRQFFQPNDSVRIFEKMRFVIHSNKECKGASPDKCFVIFALLGRDKTYQGYTNITLKYLANYLFETQSTGNIKTLKKCIKALKHLELVSYDFNIDKISSTDLIKVTVNNEEYQGCKQYLDLFNEDFALLEKVILGFKFFTIYCCINNNYHKDHEGSNISYDTIASICNMSKPTVCSEVKKAFALGIYNTPKIKYIYNEVLEKYVKPCNKYIIDRNRVMEISNMSDEEIERIIESVNIREEQELERMNMFLGEGGHSVNDEILKQIKKEYKALPDKVKAEVQELCNKQLEYSDDTEYRNIAYVYSYYKVRAKNIALEKAR